MNKLKKIYKILFAGLVMGLSFFAGCKKEAEIFPPEACLTMVRDSLGTQTPLPEGGFIYAGEQIIFKDCGSFDFGTFYSGLKGRTYDKDSVNSVVSYGEPFPTRGVVTITYPAAGSFTATLIAVNYSGTEPLRALKQVKITVLPK